ncbi:leukotriene A-4 hydrolase-like isoform X1 [Temnothorax longispinosus]|uniref:leukotriene A-4 hydrolase-like isoform X1 n=1 Tax=Temnothorax longispinosus TaxID=300112 RepID=UPI003A99F251
MDILRPTKDSHSFAIPELARVTDIHLELIVDFKRRVLKGKVILTITRLPSINQIILDNLGLVISSVTNVLDGTLLHHHHVVTNSAFGSPFCVDLPPTIGTTYNPECKIQIEYETSPNSPALYWLTAAQTGDGKHPFLLSNNKLIYARSWFPCQDTPSVKFTYSAKILVPKNFSVLMSALSHNNVDREDPQLDQYEFRQHLPVSSCAVIIAVGLLQTKKLNERMNIFAEENIFKTNYIKIFRYTAIEKMLQIAKRLCGSYMWGRYDICVLPPSIAHFEIECPCVTFISPLLLHGDRSYVGDSLARNISQSWAGNLVSCSNYEHLWLNKSFSLFISRKIRRSVLYHKGIDVYLQREGLKNLNSLVQEPKNVNKLRCLLPNLEYLSPDILTKYVPYERGYFLLCHLENMLGGPTVFELFLQSYFDNFAFRSINTADWLNYLRQKFPDKVKMLEDVEWHLWFGNIFFTPIMPELSEMSAWENKCFILAKKWINWDILRVHDIPPFMTADERNLCNIEKILLLNNLHSSHQSLTTVKLCSLNNCFFCGIQNGGEIRFSWLLLCIKVQWDKKVESALNFAVKYCSPNYAYPIFKSLCKWREMRLLMIGQYYQNKKKILNETQEKLNKIL